MTHQIPQEVEVEQEQYHCLLCEVLSHDRVCQLCLRSLSPTSVARDERWKLWNTVVHYSGLKVNPTFMQRHTDTELD